MLNLRGSRQRRALHSRKRSIFQPAPPVAAEAGSIVAYPEMQQTAQNIISALVRLMSDSRTPLLLLLALSYGIGLTRAQSSYSTYFRDPTGATAYRLDLDNISSDNNNIVANAIIDGAKGQKSSDAIPGSFVSIYQTQTQVPPGEGNQVTENLYRLLNATIQSAFETLLKSKMDDPYGIHPKGSHMLEYVLIGCVAALVLIPLATYIGVRACRSPEQNGYTPIGP